ncbi:MAG: PAS domain S-box protein [Syntrophaceae bacterium]|nr:PAS domain S-box protein [Syntrophaceae bacterium]
MRIKSKPSVKTKASINLKATAKRNKKISAEQAEELIRQSEERYRTILEEMDDAYFEVDLAGNFTFVNDANSRLLGYSKKELLGSSFRTQMPEDDAERVYNVFSNIYKTGNSVRDISYKVIKKDGTTGFAETAGFPIKNQKGEIVGFKGVGREITKRKEMEEALRQSEEKYRVIIESIKDGYFEIDLSGNFIFFNESLCEIHGYPREELMGMNHRQYADKENVKRVFEAFNKIYSTGESGSIFDYEIIRKDGTKRQVEVSASLKKDSSGNPTGFRGITRDVTARQQTENALRQSEERYRTILEEMEEAYFEVDLAGNYTYVNDANCRILQYSREEMLRKNFRFAMADDDFELVYNTFKNIYATGKPQKNIIFKGIRKDGTMGFAELTGFLLKNQEGESIGFRGIGFDITERRKLEEALRQSEERYRTIIEEMEEWYFETDLTGNILFFNDAITRALKYPAKGLTGLNFRAFIKQEQAEEIYKIFNQVYKTGEPVKNFPQEFVRPDGSITYAEFSIFPKRDEIEKIFGFRGVGHDITERKKTEQQLKHIATHDSLTGLPNRVLFMDRLKMAIAHAKRNKHKLAVMMLDLDRFKNINDSLGHMVGDQLLKEIGIRLTDLLRQNDTISRLGGDEFIVLLPEIVRMEDAGEVAGKIINVIQRPFICDNNHLITSTSIGIAIYPDDCHDIDSLMKNADTAMYSVKAHGRNSYRFFVNVNH